MILNADLEIFTNGYKFIKMIFQPIKTTIVTLFNSIIATGIFSNAWKDAIVCPIPKSQNPAGNNDFRPISLLPVLGKVFEVVVRDQIVVFITKHKLFSKFQSAYRHFHSTTSAAQLVTNCPR